MAGKDPNDVFKYYSQALATSDPEKYGPNGIITRILAQEPKTGTSLPTFEEFVLSRVKSTQTEELAERTRRRVQFYEQKVGNYPQEDYNQSSSETIFGSPNRAQKESFGLQPPEPTRSTTSSATQTDVHTPFRTVPLCAEHSTTWELVYRDNKGVTWTRFKRNRQQEWLTGTILPNNNWEFSLSLETNDFFPA